MRPLSAAAGATAQRPTANRWRCFMLDFVLLDPSFLLLFFCSPILYVSFFLV